MVVFGWFTVCLMLKFIKYILSFCIKFAILLFVPVIVAGSILIFNSVNLTNFVTINKRQIQDAFPDFEVDFGNISNENIIDGSGKIGLNMYNTTINDKKRNIRLETGEVRLLFSFIDVIRGKFRPHIKILKDASVHVYSGSGNTIMPSINALLPQIERIVSGSGNAIIFGNTAINNLSIFLHRDKTAVDSIFINKININPNGKNYVNAKGSIDVLGELLLNGNRSKFKVSCIHSVNMLCNARVLNVDISTLANHSVATMSPKIMFNNLISDVDVVMTTKDSKVDILTAKINSNVSTILISDNKIPLRTSIVANITTHDDMQLFNIKNITLNIDKVGKFYVQGSVNLQPTSNIISDLTINSGSVKYTAVDTVLRAIAQENGKLARALLATYKHVDMMYGDIIIRNSVIKTYRNALPTVRQIQLEFLNTSVKIRKADDLMILADRALFNLDQSSWQVNAQNPVAFGSIMDSVQVEYKDIFRNDIDGQLNISVNCKQCAIASILASANVPQFLRNIATQWKIASNSIADINFAMIIQDVRNFTTDNNVSYSLYTNIANMQSLYLNSYTLPITLSLSKKLNDKFISIDANLTDAVLQVDDVVILKDTATPLNIAATFSVQQNNGVNEVSVPSIIAQSNEKQLLDCSVNALLANNSHNSTWRIGAKTFNILQSDVSGFVNKSIGHNYKFDIKGSKLNINSIISVWHKLFRSDDADDITFRNLQVDGYASISEVNMYNNITAEDVNLGINVNDGIAGNINASMQLRRGTIPVKDYLSLIVSKNIAKKIDNIYFRATDFRMLSDAFNLNNYKKINAGDVLINGTQTDSGLVGNATITNFNLAEDGDALDINRKNQKATTVRKIYTDFMYDRNISRLFISKGSISAGAINAYSTNGYIDFVNRIAKIKGNFYLGFNDKSFSSSRIPIIGLLLAPYNALTLGLTTFNFTIDGPYNNIEKSTTIKAQHPVLIATVTILLIIAIIVGIAVPLA
jgi:hypothetical protein